MTLNTQAGDVVGKGDANKTVIRRAASIPELSKEYGVGESLLYNLANSGQLPGARRLGKRIIVHLPTFDAWMREGQGA